MGSSFSTYPAGQLAITGCTLTNTAFEYHRIQLCRINEGDVSEEVCKALSHNPSLHDLACRDLTSASEDERLYAVILTEHLFQLHLLQTTHMWYEASCVKPQVQIRKNSCMRFIDDIDFQEDYHTFIDKTPPPLNMAELACLCLSLLVRCRLLVGEKTELETSILDYLHDLEVLTMHHSVVAGGSVESRCGSVPSGEMLRANFTRFKDALGRTHLKEVHVSTWHLLCGITGLSFNFATGMLDDSKDSDHSFRDHWFDEQWCEKFLEACTPDSKEEWKTRLRYVHKVSDGFEKTGICPSRSRYLSARRSRTGEVAMRSTIYSFAQHHVAAIFNQCIFLHQTPVLFPLPGRHGIFNIVPDEEESMANADMEPCWYVNATDASHALLDTHTSNNDSKYCMLYHATTHSGACNIINQGIRLEYGGKRQDFSSHSGFYLTNWEHAVEAARCAPFPTTPAIMVFRIPHAYLANDVKMCDLYNPDADEDERIRLKRTWTLLVNYCRLGTNRCIFWPKDSGTKDKAICDAVHDAATAGRCKKGSDVPKYDCIWGMSAQYPLEYNARVEGEKEDMTLPFKEGHLQMCITSERMAETLSEQTFLRGVIFFSDTCETC